MGCAEIGVGVKPQAVDAKGRQWARGMLTGQWG